jgi:hypothetical protein
VIIVFVLPFSATAAGKVGGEVLNHTRLGV